MEKFTFTVTMDGKDITRHVPFPIKWENLLDEQLDIARITINQLSDKIIHPLTPVSIDIKDSADRHKYIDMVVGTDVTQEIPVGSGKFNHEVTLIEQTKILEGIVVDALTFTNDLGRNYTANAKAANYEYATLSLDGWSSYKDGGSLDIEKYPTYLNPKPENTEFKILTAEEYWAPESPDYWYEERKVYFNNSEINVVNNTILLQGGTYMLEYSREYKQSTQYPQGRKERITFNVVDNYAPLPRWNIASVIDRVLDLAEPHLQGVEPRFHLNGKDLSGQNEHTGQYKEFEQIEAPEFAFTNSTLREILDQIGGYIHGMARLRGNEIYYDILGGTEQAEIADPQYSYYQNVYTQDIESYCSSLDSTVDNMVCLIDPPQGTITEPYYGGYKTVRTETVYARINENNMFIATQYPIQEIKSVKCGKIPGKDFEGGDITPYIFEEAEYNRMSAYSKNYPNSKSYALYYTQGTKNIYGLNFHPDTASDWVPDNSIVRILEETTGQKIGGLKETYPLLSFQVSYIPVFSARTQQTKQYIGDIKQPRTLCYNQGANLVETRHFGENMKGAVARMGNVDRVMMYNLSTFRILPKVGQLYGDDYYIAGIACEVYPEYLKCQLTLSQDFNRLSQYIGINSTRRFYEVSEKAAYRRDIKYPDYVVIGDKAEEDTTCVHIREIVNIFWQYTPSQSGISYAIARGYDENNERKTEVILPVISTAQGNAMVFTFNYEDNYSAGTQVQEDESGSVSGYFTNSVAPWDYYGRMPYLSFRMGVSSSASQTDKEKLALPQKISDNISPNTINTGTPGLVIKKDGAEILSVNYVLEFVTNKKNYIIGSALARNCPLVRGSNPNKRAELYIMPQRIGKFDNKINIDEGTFVWRYRLEEGHITMDTTTGKSLKFEDFTPTVSGAAWAIVDGVSGELLIGSNEPITAGQTVSMPYMTLRHDIFNLGGNQ